jgi:hypothetical protein
MSGTGNTVAGGTAGTMNVDMDHSFERPGVNAGASFVGENNADGSSTASDTVVGFSQVTGDRIFFANETTTRINQVIATGTVNGSNLTITLPDGSHMTLIGITSINSTFFK